MGGLDTLTAMEQIEVDNKDRPIEDIVIERASVFVDPYQEADDQLAAERAEEMKKIAEEKAAANRAAPKKDAALKVYRSGVGKYIPKLENIK